MGMGEKGEWTKSEGEGRAGAWGARGQVGARVGGAGDRFGGVPTRAHVAGGVGMRFGHQAVRVEHQHPPALRAHHVALPSHRSSAAADLHLHGAGLANSLSATCLGYFHELQPHID